MKIENLLELEPFSMNRSEKNSAYNEIFKKLSQHHYSKCNDYRKIIDAINFDVMNMTDFRKLPSIPVRLFKEYDLKSVKDDEIIKKMTSSGTSGQKVSRIYLDRSTATNQTKVLAKIMSDFLGNKRLPMLIIDTEEILKNRNNFSARAAGILGFRTFGHDATFALNEDMTINFELLNDFLDKYSGKDILIFGFTSIIWEHFHKVLINSTRESVDIKNGILIHGGGWKKLENQSVDSMTFRKKIKESCGINRIHNYYGMIEQTGSIYMECEEGHLHCSNFSDIEIVNNKLEPDSNGNSGLIKLYSTLPHSYPGHVILTEDIGEIIGEDNCRCGKKGKYFKVHGRVKDAEIRGCSDTYQS
tara:strand:+ start:7217 stop:8290 length:1074 start_codon:yes stop_codon:yes gene_type:complete